MGRAVGFDEQSRYNELIDRVFGEVGIVPPGVLVEVDPVDWRLPRLQQHWSLRAVQAAVAAVTSGIGLQNNSNNALLVVTRAMNTSGTQATIVRTTTLPANYVDSLSQIPRLQDCRGARGTAGVAPVRTLVKALGGASAVDLGFYILEGAAPAWVTPDDWWCVLGPGQSLLIEAIAVNAALSVQLQGYVRPARPEELQGL